MLVFLRGTPTWRPENSKSFSLHTIALTREAKLWEDTHNCQGKGRVNVGYMIDRHQGR